MVSDDHRGETVPLHVEGDQGLEQAFGVGDVGDQIEVDEEELALADPADILDHPLHRPLPLVSAPGGGRHAELAVMGAGTGRLEDRLGEELASVEQLTAGKGQVLMQLESRVLLVVPLESAGGKVIQQPGPGLLAVTAADGLGMLHGLLRQEGDMGTAEHHRNALVAEAAGQFVTAFGGAGDHGHADQIGLQLGRDFLNTLIDQFDLGLQLRRDQRRQGGERQGLIA